jgi:ferredoxin-NADP reductase
VLSSTTSLWFGILFVGLGAACVWLVLEASSRTASTKRTSRLIAAHRIGGYLFIAVFFLMLYSMTGRLEAGTSGASAIHSTLALVLAPLIFLKVLVARRYRNQSSTLLPLGVLIFVIAFLLVAITSWRHIANFSAGETISLNRLGLPGKTINGIEAAQLMQQKCSKCHNLDRVVGAKKDAKGWISTVIRMQSLPDSGLSDSDVRMIAAYLSSRTPDDGEESRLSVERAVVDQRCGRCHTLERVYGAAKSPEDWHEVVSRMQGYAAGGAGALRPGEALQIIHFLSMTQTPDAANQRNQSTQTNQAEGQVQLANLPVQRMASLLDLKPIFLGACVLLGLGFLAVRRPARTAVTTPARIPEKPTSSTPARGMILRLVSITRQTHDANTLRFALPFNQGFNFRPGQFLTFTFLFDGRKEIRCYSICSSPATSGYVEITPKRMKNGCVSVYLNDQAHCGLTVEAAGPFGEFYFDPERQKNIVLIAAGSGITPMLSMLRWIEDLRIECRATLLYCARASADIIFCDELARLASVQKSFQYHVLLSDPEPEWPGRRGRIDRQFIVDTVDDLIGTDFFLCGPPPFMELARNILLELGVQTARVQQERFEGPTPTGQPNVAPQAQATIEFTKCAKSSRVQPGQTILQVAEQCGIQIPFYCRQGQCGTCKTRLLAGSVSMESEAGLDANSKSLGFVLTCVGHPNGDIKVDV